MAKKAAFTHLLTLLTGIVIRKLINADELEAYRSSLNDSAMRRIRQGIKLILVTEIVLDLIFKTGRMAIGNGGGGAHDSGRSNAR